MLVVYSSSYSVYNPHPLLIFLLFEKMFHTSVFATQYLQKAYSHPSVKSTAICNANFKRTRKSPQEGYGAIFA